MNNREQQDLVWKALADPTRRDMLDALAAGPLSTGDLVEQFDSLCRTNVMKHLDILVQASLVVVRREGRMRWNYLNPVPIQRICDRWVSKHVKKMASALSHLKDHVEQSDADQGSTQASEAVSSKTKRDTAKQTAGDVSPSAARRKSRKRTSPKTATSQASGTKKRTRKSSTPS